MSHSVQTSGHKTASAKKSHASKASAKPRSPARKLHGNGEERRHMIETAAYFHAQKRGFTGGDPVMDWLEAEAEIDAMFKLEPDLNVH